MTKLERDALLEQVKEAKADRQSEIARAVRDEREAIIGLLYKVRTGPPLGADTFDYLARLIRERGLE